MLIIIINRELLQGIIRGGGDALMGLTELHVTPIIWSHCWLDLHQCNIVKSAKSWCKKVDQETIVCTWYSWSPKIQNNHFDPNRVRRCRLQSRAELEGTLGDQGESSQSLCQGVGDLFVFLTEARMKNMIKVYIENINEIGWSKGVLSIFLLYIVKWP